MAFWFSRKAVRTPAASRSFRPTVELLEDRVVPTLSGTPLSVSSSSQTDTNPATAMASNGSNVSMGIVVWTQSNSNGDTDIMARTGSPPPTLGSTFTVANTPANEDNADVAMDQNGDFVVVWVSTQNNNSDILYAFYRANQTIPFQSGAVAATSLQEVDPQV